MTCGVVCPIATSTRLASTKRGAFIYQTYECKEEVMLSPMPEPSSTTNFRPVLLDPGPTGAQRKEVTR